MHPALWRLMNLRLVGFLRRLSRGLRTVKGAAFFVVGVVLCCAWIIPGVLQGLLVEHGEPGQAGTFIRWGLLLWCLITVLTNSSENAVFFHPAEIDILFPGPFTRRQLLVYKVSCAAAAQFLSALFLSVIFWPHANYWVAGFLGIYATFMFLQLFSMALGLLRQTIAERAYTRGRRLALFLLAGLVTAAGLLALGSAGPGELSWQRFLDSPLTAVALAPFSVFANTITARTILPGLVGWLAAALAIDLALLAVVIRLDAGYSEAAIATSQKLYSRIQKMRRGQGWMMTAGPVRSHWRLPMLPWLAGGGPIAWRQLVGVLRTAGSVLLFLLLMTIVAGGSAVVPVLMRTEQELAETAAWIVLGLASYATFFLLIGLRRDFRGDVDHMDVLKALPIPASGMVVGQLLAPVLLLTAIQFLAIAAAVLLSGRSPILIAGLYLVPANVLLVGMENTFFLLFPDRVAGVQVFGFQQVGRQMVVFLAEFLTLLLVFAVAFSLGGFAFWLSGESLVAFLAVSWLLLTVESAAVLPLATWAYRRYDVAADTPA